MNRATNLDPSRIPTGPEQVPASPGINPSSSVLSTGDRRTPQGTNVELRRMGRTPAAAGVGRRNAAATGGTQSKDFLGIRKAWKSISWFTAIKFTALVVSMALLATGHLFVGIVLGAVVTILLLRDLGNAAINAQAIRDEVQQARANIAEANAVHTRQMEEQERVQAHAAAMQQNLTAAQARAVELQRLNADLRIQAESDQTAFAAVGEQLAGIVSQFDTYATQVQTSIQAALQEVSSSREQTLASLGAANSAIQAAISKADETLSEQSTAVNHLIEQQRNILREGIEAYQSSDKPEREKVQALVVAIGRATELNVSISEKSTALSTAVKAAIGEIKDTVNTQIQELNRQFTEKHTNVASKLVNLSGLVAQREAINASIAQLRQQHDRAWFGGRGDLPAKIAEQERLLAEIQRNIEVGKEECNALGADLEQFVNSNGEIAKIVARLDHHLDRIDSHAQSVASGFSWMDALGVAGGALAGALFIGGLPAAGAVAAGAGAGRLLVAGAGRALAAMNPLAGLGDINPFADDVGLL